MKNLSCPADTSCLTRASVGSGTEPLKPPIGSSAATAAMPSRAGRAHAGWSAGERQTAHRGRGAGSSADSGRGSADDKDTSGPPEWA